MVSTPLLVAALVVSGLMLGLLAFSFVYARWLRNGGRLFLGSGSEVTAPVDLTNEHGEIDPVKQIKHLKKTTAEFGIKYSELVFGKMLGKGSQGEVFRATWRGSQVAVKKVDTRKVPPEIIEEVCTHAFCQEAHIMRRLRHPSLTLFMGVSLEHPHLCILTELCSRGSLFDIIHDEHAALTWPKCLIIALDVAKGMTYLHAHSPPILHRDLKSLNILVDQNWRGKVADFGMTRFQEDGTMTQCLESSTRILLADGRVVAINDPAVKIGTMLAGEAGPVMVISKREAFATRMYQITHTDGFAYTVTPNHLVTLRFTAGPEALIRSDCSNDGSSRSVQIVWWQFDGQSFEQKHSEAQPMPMQEGVSDDELCAQALAAWSQSRVAGSAGSQALLIGDLIDVRAELLASPKVWNLLVAPDGKHLATSRRIALPQSAADETELKAGGVELASIALTGEASTPIVIMAVDGDNRFALEDGTLTHNCGSPLWMAPEMIRNDPYAEKSDVFSFGICLWEMYTRKIPYRDLGLNPSHLVVKVVKEHLRPPIPKQCPKAFRNLMEKCWAPLPEKRPTFPQILKILEAFVADPAIVNHKPMSSRDATIIVRPEKIEPEQPYATAGGDGGAGGAGGILGISSAERGWKVDPAELHFYNDAQVLFQEVGGAATAAADATAATRPRAASKTAAELKDAGAEPAVAEETAAATPTSKSGAKKKSSSSSSSSSSDKKKSSSGSAKTDPASASVSSADLSAAPPAGTPAPLVHNTNIKATKDAKDDDVNSGSGSSSGGGTMAPQGAGMFLAKFRNKLVSIKPCFLDSSHLQMSNEERVMADLEGKDARDSKLATFMRRMAGLRHPNIVLFLGAYIEPVEALKAKLKESGQLAGSVLDDQPFGAAASASAAAAAISRGAGAASSTTPRPPPAGCEYYLGSVSEFMSRGTLHDVLCDSSLVLDWATMIQLLLDAAAGMAYLHGNRPNPVIHQDFTSRRLLVDRNWRVRVGEYAFVDLNLALSSASNAQAVMPPTIWSAPEYIKHPNTTNQSMAGNVYSFGCLMWQAMVRRPLWDDRPLTKELSDKIVKQGDRPPLPESFGSRDLKNLIEKCWMASPAARPSFVQILEELTRLKALGPPKIHLTLGINAHKYRKAKTVFAYRSKDPVTILKDWGTNIGKRNCLVLFSGEDDVYLCDEEVFKATYEPLDQGEGELDGEVDGGGAKRSAAEEAGAAAGEEEKKETTGNTKTAVPTTLAASSSSASATAAAPGSPTSPSSPSSLSPVDPLSGHHEWRKTGTVLAKLMEEAFSVRTDTGGTEHGMAGDYLVQDMAGKDQWSVEAKTFLELYERWD